MRLEEFMNNEILEESRIYTTYHNHNYLCKHSEGTVEDFVKQAKSLGYKKIGISDHAPMPGLDDRMSMEDFINRYLPQFDFKIEGIKVYKGVEAEFRDKDIEHLKWLRSHVDYMVLGMHGIPYPDYEKWVFRDTLTDMDVVEYKNAVLRALHTGLFSILAHPDIVFYKMEYLSDTAVSALEEIVLEANRLGVYLEVNANGLRKHGLGHLKYRYPRQEYLDLLKKHNIKPIISDDAHYKEYIGDSATKALYAYLRQEGIEVEYDPDIVKTKH